MATVAWNDNPGRSTRREDLRRGNTGEEFGKMEKVRVLASLEDSPSPLP